MPENSLADLDRRMARRIERIHDEEDRQVAQQGWDRLKNDLEKGHLGLDDLVAHVEAVERPTRPKPPPFLKRHAQRSAPERQTSLQKSAKATTRLEALTAELDSDDPLRQARALREIRDEKLYRPQHRSFRRFLADRSLGREYVYRLIQFLGVFENVQDVLGPFVLNERQAREIARLTPAQQRKAIRQVRKAVENGAEPTWKLFREAAQQ